MTWAHAIPTMFSLLIFLYNLFLKFRPVRTLKHKTLYFPRSSSETKLELRLSQNRPTIRLKLFYLNASNCPWYYILYFTPYTYMNKRLIPQGRQKFNSACLYLSKSQCTIKVWLASFCIQMTSVYSHWHASTGNNFFLYVKGPTIIIFRISLDK